MQLPQSNILTTKYLNRVFDKTVATYKYYWFLGIWKSHATLTPLAKQDCPLWLQYD